MALNLMKDIDKFVSGIIIISIFNDKWRSKYIGKGRLEYVSIAGKIVGGLE